MPARLSHRKLLDEGVRFELDVLANWRSGRQENTELQVHRRMRRRGARAGYADLFYMVDPDVPSFFTLLEVKNTDWNKTADHRVRPNVLRHIRQLWSYIEPLTDPLRLDRRPAGFGLEEWETEQLAQGHAGEGLTVMWGILYPHEPSDEFRKDAIEQMFEERMIAVVWGVIDERFTSATKEDFLPTVTSQRSLLASQ